MDVRVLIVEDERKVAQLLAQGIGEEGYDVAVSYDGLAALELLEREAFDAVVLDVMLPGKDGRAVCRTLRERRPQIGIVMLSALGEVQDRLQGLASGADDYLAKPFAFEELLLRLKALERRLPRADRLGGRLMVDPLRGVLVGPRGQAAVSPREATLLAMFLAHAGETLSRERLWAEAWDTHFQTHTNQVDVYVNYVRKKLAAVGAADWLQTVRGEGYRLVPGGEP